jgi:uncharacterized membrane protein YgaE (UPF0421/DUF939 family)
MARLLDVAAVQLSVRAAFSAALGVAISQRLHLEIPLNTMISAVLVTDLDARRTRALGAPRLLGTVVGALLGATICSLFGPGVERLGLGVLFAMLLMHLLRLQAAAKVAGYVCGIVLLGFGAHPWVYAAHRLAETSVGVAVAVLVSFVPKLLGSRERKGPADAA